MTKNKLLILIPIIATVGAILFYLYSFNIELTQIQYEQQARIKSVSAELDEFVIVSNSLSKFIEKDLNDKFLNKDEIEKKLYQYLSSAPSNIIYGVGIWFEPYKLNSKQELNGIYIHQNLEEKDKFVLTYEWNTKEYYYPTQAWYLSGLKVEESTFTEPYFDQGIVYTTNARSFSQKKQKTGVITVDLIVPLLQEIVKRHSPNADDYVYILDKNKRILAHFEKEMLLKNKNYNSLLDLTENEVIKTLKIDSNYQLVSSEVNEKLGWVIKAQSAKVLGFTRTRDLFLFLLMAQMIVWLIFLYIKRVMYNIDIEKAYALKETENNKIQLLQASKMASLGEMASGVAHEINGPLMVILGKTKQLKRSLRSEQSQIDQLEKDIAVIEKTVFRISKIISGLRTFSRSSENDELGSENLKTIIEDTKSLISEKVKHSGIELIIIDPNDDIKLRCRPGQISQVLVNLISNAHDAVSESLKDSKWIKIQTQIYTLEKKIIIEVSDSGDGIDTTIKEKIMNPFFTTKEVGKGTGLGLSISKGIIEEHGGKFYLKESTNETTFVIELPLFIHQPM